MNRTEHLFVPGDENNLNKSDGKSSTSNSDRVKMGEVFKLKKDQYSLICVHCSAEFQYFSEFVLHVEEHLTEKLTDESLQKSYFTEIKEEYEKYSSGDDSHPFDNEEHFGDCLNDENSEDIIKIVKVEENIEKENIGHDEKVVDVYMESDEKPMRSNAETVKNENSNESVASKLKEVKTPKSDEELDTAHPNDPFSRYKEELECTIISVELIDTPPFQLRSLAPYLVQDYQFERSGKSLKCPMCSCCFKDNTSVRRHIFVHTNCDHFVCGLCSRKFRAPRYLQRHLKNDHHLKKQSYECFVCHKQFKMYKTLKRHRDLRCENATKTECDQVAEPNCDEYDGIFKKSKKRRRTYGKRKSYLSKKEMEMPKAMKNLLKKAVKANEIASNEELDQFRAELACSLDSVNFSYIDTKESRLLAKFSLFDYQFEKTEDDLFLCPICKSCNVNKKYRSPNHIRRHLFMHANAKFFQCGLCTQKYRVALYLQRHLIDNHDIKPERKFYECYLCHKSIITVNRLVQHMETHLSKKKGSDIPAEPKPPKKYVYERRPRLCELCGIQLSTKRSMIEHMTLHTSGGIKLHSCTLCNKSFRLRRYVLRHVRKVHLPKIKKDIQPNF